MTGLPPATALRSRGETKLLVLRPGEDRLEDRGLRELPALLAPGDVLVVNDAATLPASLAARAPDGEALELRLLEAPSTDGLVWAMLYRAGTWRTATEARSGPQALELGTKLRFEGSSLHAEIIERSASSARLVLLLFDGAPTDLIELLYRLGRPIQYSYLRDELPLWAVQTPFAERPWAVEPPSASLNFSFDMLQSLRQRGVSVARLTHGAGVSSTGDATVDARLPLSERYEIPQATVRAIERTKYEGGRVIAAGTTVVRALEGAQLRGRGRLSAGAGRTNLRIGPKTKLAIIDGLLTGMHQPGESHFEILRALVSEPLLARAHEHAQTAGYLAHELGDCTLVCPQSAFQLGL